MRLAFELWCPLGKQFRSRAASQLNRRRSSALKSNLLIYDTARQVRKRLRDYRRKSDVVASERRHTGLNDRALLAVSVYSFAP